MNFAEIIYQSALFTATFFVFNKLFSRYIFKNREEMSISFGRIVTMFVLYVVFGTSVNFLIEKYSTPVNSESQQQVLASGQSMTVPTIESVATPLKLDMNFSSDVAQEELTTVVTDLGEYVFSTRGATLQAMTLLWQNNQRVVMLGKGDQYFAVALNDITPIAYKLVSSQEIMDGAAHEVVYHSVHHPTLEKKFVIYKNKYQIDVAVSCKNASDHEQIRLLVPAPVMTDELTAVVNVPTVQDRLKLQDIALNKKENLAQFWFEPKLFGFTSRFFTNVCFASNLQANGRVYVKESEDKTFQAIFESKPFDKQADFSWSFYFGPKSVQNLKQVSPALPVLVDYGMLSFLAKPLANSLIFVQEKTGSYGWAIILIALILKLLMVPFTLRSERGMREQAEFEKKRQHLQQKFKHDKAALDKATAELIQKHGLPIFSGCLPMLLNIPVFIALNKVLTSSTELYGASFLWLPDLSAADPFYILSIATFFGMLFAPSMASAGGPRQMFSKIGFALFLAAVTSYLASGLALFVVLNTLFGVAQSFVIKKIRWLKARYA
jgi:YidC/Oxa1 family membrane protein insertase